MQTLQTLNKAQTAAVAQYREWCETTNARDAAYINHQAECSEGKSHWGTRTCRECILLHESKMQASRARLRYYNIARDKRVTMAILNSVINEVDAAARAAAVETPAVVETSATSADTSTVTTDAPVVADADDTVDPDAADPVEAPQELGVAFGAVVVAEIARRIAKGAWSLHGLTCKGCDDVCAALYRDVTATATAVQWRVIDLQRAGGTAKEICLAFERGRDATLAFVN